MRFQFIEENQETFEISLMCRVLKVSRSGFYAWRKREPSVREMANRELTQEIKVVFEESGQTYGSPRVYAELKAKDIACSRHRVARLMQQNEWQAKQKRRKWVKTTDSAHNLPIAPNLLNREFEAESPNQKWGTDISYIPTDEGWLYVATVMDLFSRRIVGWSMQADMSTALVLNALDMATQTRKPKAGLLHHSDRGSQYCSHLYQQRLAAHQMKVSMSRKGNCWDNAPMESFFGSLKTEMVYHCHFRTHDEARREIFAYIEGFYNRRRRHSTLNYMTPIEYEMAYQLCLN